LIQQGAKLTTHTDDILEELNIESRSAKSQDKPLNPQDSVDKRTELGKTRLTTSRVKAMY